MFEGRLKILMVLLAVPVAAVIARLVQLQILHASDYQHDTREMLERPARYFPFLRGQITDRRGLPLAYDAPSWDICVDYRFIIHDQDYLRKVARRYGLGGADVSEADALGEQVAATWEAIATLSGLPIAELKERAERKRRQVVRIKESVSRAHGVEKVVREERMTHPVVRGLDQEAQVAAQVTLAPFPWIEIKASHTRQYAGGPAMGHLLGRLVEVDLDALSNDPLGGDELARYMPGSMHGVRGAEALGEMWLRGRRGRIEENLLGEPITDPVDPEHGAPFRLTIDYRLQQALYNRLAAAVEATEFRTGGCAVVIHVPTRQVLAMVDYPSVDPNASYEQRQKLADRRARQPFLFRAIRGYYPPGSTVKPLLLAAGLADGRVGPQTRFTCYGHLFLDYPDRWRCTGVHGTIGPVYAVQHSCNVYFFHVGESLGVSTIVDWFGRFGFGRDSGTGLVGELPGRLPDPSPSRGLARNLAIGQGAFDVTPIQVANMTASIAEGAYRPVTLWADDAADRPRERLPVRPEHWRLVREGMYQVVNTPGGTAYGDARGTLGSDRYVMLGKTGSAEVVRGRTVKRLFVCHFPDGRVAEIVAKDEAEVLERYEEDGKPRIAGWRSYERYPPDAPEPFTHAWFTGYVTGRSGYLDDVGDGANHIAIAVMIEYTGHGGEVASPVARDMVQTVLTLYEGALRLPGDEGGR